MSFMSKLLLCVAVLISAVAIVAQVKAGPAVTIDPATQSGSVLLTPLDTQAENLFAKTFQIPRYGEYRPYALLLTNSSGQAIVALTIRWTITAGERTGVYDARTDNFGLAFVGASGSSVQFPLPMPGQPRQQHPVRPIGSSHSSAEGVVAANGERVLVTPGLFMRESWAKKHDRPGAASGLPEAVRSATAITASIDTVILEDGTVLGPDASHTIDTLKATKASIVALLDAVRTAEQNGQDSAATLREVANARPTRDGGGPSPQERMLARVLMGWTDWKTRLEKMADIQLPNFHR